MPEINTSMIVITLYVTEKVLAGETKVEHKPSGEMLADILTKSLPASVYQKS
jgi:hypothetical protein